jgi:hypothetical protein
LSFENVKVAEAEALRTAAGNMCGTVMRGTVAPPGSETSSSRQGSCRNLGGLLSPAAALAVPGRIGKLERATPVRKTGEVGRPHSTGEASNNANRQAGGGECGGKGRRKGKGQRMPRTQSRNRHVPDGPRPRTGTGAQAPNAFDLRQEPSADTEGAAKQKAARRDLRGGQEVTPVPCTLRGVRRVIISAGTARKAVSLRCPLGD